MNEFVVILKLINFKNDKLKKEIMINFKFNDYKNIFTLVVSFFQIHIRNSQKRIIETEPTKWLHSKDPWKSE